MSSEETSSSFSEKIVFCSRGVEMRRVLRRSSDSGLEDVDRVLKTSGHRSKGMATLESTGRHKGSELENTGTEGLEGAGPLSVLAIRPRVPSLGTR